jgi:hypothetical protein
MLRLKQLQQQNESNSNSNSAGVLGGDVGLGSGFNGFNGLGAGAGVGGGVLGGDATRDKENALFTPVRASSTKQNYLNTKDANTTSKRGLGLGGLSGKYSRKLDLMLIINLCFLVKKEPHPNIMRVPMTNKSSTPLLHKPLTKNKNMSSSQLKPISMKGPILSPSFPMTLQKNKIPHSQSRHFPQSSSKTESRHVKTPTISSAKKHTTSAKQKSSSSNRNTFVTPGKNNEEKSTAAPSTRLKIKLNSQTPEIQSIPNSLSSNTIQQKSVSQVTLNVDVEAETVQEDDVSDIEYMPPRSVPLEPGNSPSTCPLPAFLRNQNIIIY